MSNIKELLSAQSLEIDELQRLIRNYKSDGPDRKTPRYLNDKLKTFEEMYIVISTNNEKIIKLIDGNQPYLIENMFAKMKTKYDILNRFKLCVRIF